MALLAALLLAAAVPSLDGFAYAPNFITKIIEQSTGVPPVGLLDVGGGAPADAADADAAEATAPVLPLAGPLTTRFPPEPNGYLHLGHAKAVAFNFAVARAFAAGGGRCHLRMDDTNPSKEDAEYVESIVEDVRWIQRGLAPCRGAEGEEEKEAEEGEAAGPWFGPVRKTSDYFELIYAAALALIDAGDAFVDELSADEMREYRGTLTAPGRESPHRDRPAAESRDLFQRMRAGEFADGTYALRARIDMASPNLNLRDPVLYRIKHARHQATGDAWCLYPMYDFSHPIADAAEGVTHSLCTLEFEDHRPLYDWVATRMVALGLVEALPRQIEFSRLNVKYTLLSKRKLIALVEGAHVTGWDDPRMPTLSGLRRRGLPPAALRRFCERAGVSKTDSNIDAGALEDCAREVLDEESPRAFAILAPLRVTLTNWSGSALEDFEVPRHPKREELGGRTVPFGKTVYIERSDFFDLEGPEGEANGRQKPRGFKRLLPDGRVRLKRAYVIRCDEVLRDAATREPVELRCTYYPETRAGVTPEGETRVKGIIQWVEATAGARCRVMQYDRLFRAEEPGKESGDFLTDLNPDSLTVVEDVRVEPAVALSALAMLAKIRQSETGPAAADTLYHADLAYQFERSGYFALDAASTPENLVFNRVVTLRDTWGAPRRAPKADRKEKSKDAIRKEKNSHKSKK